LRLFGIDQLRRRYWRLQPGVQRRLKIAVPYFALGLLVLILAIIFFDSPNWTVWALFTGLYVLLEMFAVEVNDRLFQSSSIMVAMTAGVIFALDTNSSASLGMALMAALGPFVVDDFKQRRWFQPMANFGQQVVALAVAGLILDLGLGRVSEASVQTLFLVVPFAAIAALVLTAIQNAMVREAVQVVYPYDRLQPWSHLGTLFLGQFVMGLLGGLIGGAYFIADRSAILVLVIGVYGIGHLSLYAFSQLRVSHISAIKGFVKTLEAKDMYTRGHTERVAHFAEMIGEEYGFSGTEIEEIKWAALIHDLGKLAVPTELIRKRGRLDEEEYGQMKAHAHLVEEILAEVDFLQPMVEIASGHHSHYDGNGYGGRGHIEGETPSLAACIVSVADAFDAMTSARSYRMALSQQYALGELRRHSGAQFHPDVVDVFERALQKSGRRWGAPHVNDEEMARRLAEEPELTLRG
jgi:HD-GYP domain-containing protein (c-di-GMP phosphodiesterase class II)